MNNFKTQVALDLYIDRPSQNFEIETKNMNLRWNLDLEMREYGIKSFIITVPDQTLNVTLRIWGEEEDSFEELTLELKDVTIEKNEGELGSLVPHTLEFYKGKWKLVF